MVPEISVHRNVSYLLRVRLFEMLRNTAEVIMKLLILNVAKTYSRVNVCLY
jgi:hypothetical protein